MSTDYRLGSGVQVTRFWSAGHFEWQINGPFGWVTLDAGEIADLFALLDPVVADALLKDARERLP